MKSGTVTYFITVRVGVLIRSRSFKKNATDAAFSVIADHVRATCPSATRSQPTMVMITSVVDTFMANSHISVRETYTRDRTMMP